VRSASRWLAKVSRVAVGRLAANSASGVGQVRRVVRRSCGTRWMPNAGPDQDGRAMWRVVRSARDLIARRETMKTVFQRACARKCAMMHTDYSRMGGGIQELESATLGMRELKGGGLFLAVLRIWAGPAHVLYMRIGKAGRRPSGKFGFRNEFCGVG